MSGSSDTHQDVQNGPQCNGLCPEGKMCPGATAEPEPCAAGGYCPGASPFANPCPEGTFSSAIGLSAEAQCEANVCPSGSACPKGSTAPTECYPGTVALARAGNCSLCAAGRFQMESG